MPNNMQNCAVLGGSFNPPTKAHKALMQAAMNVLNAHHGIYVPSSDFYVNRKVQRSQHAKLLSEQDRLKMLRTPAMSCNGLIQTDTCEFGDMSKGRTLKTLDELQEKHPDLNLYFIMGCDKLAVFHRWPTAEELLSRHNILWVGRGHTDFNGAVNASALLTKYRDKIQFMMQPVEADDISSSQFWALKAQGKPTAYGLLEPVVADMTRDAYPD